MGAVLSHLDGVTIALHVQPRASRTEIVTEHGDQLKLRVSAPPVEGAANAEVTAWLAKRLRVPKRDIMLISGQRGRQKVVLVRGITVGEARAALGLI